MTSPLDAGLIGFQQSNKKLEFGWAQLDQEQFYQRLTYDLLQLDGGLHHQFGHDPSNDFELKYAFFGGVVDSGAAWTTVIDGTITLPNNAVSFVERTTTGVVTSNLVGFTHPTRVPMAEVTTKDGSIIDVIDRRPHDVTGGGGGGGGGCTDFPCLAGQILDTQVPLTAVKQYEAALSIAFTQLTGVATRVQLPAGIAYEDEINLFSMLNTFMAGLLTDAIGELTPAAGVTIDGLQIKDGAIPEVERHYRFVAG